MKLKLNYKYLFSLNYKLPEIPPEDIEYSPQHEVSMSFDKENNQVDLIIDCSLFNDDYPVEFGFVYFFVFDVIDKYDPAKHEDENLEEVLMEICLPYINEFAECFINKTPLPPVSFMPLIEFHES